MVRNIEKSTRFHERTKLELPVRVDFFEEDAALSAGSLTNEVTACGVDFLLSRPLEPKRLVRLRMAMPKHLRLYDFGEPRYEVWAIVSSVRIVETETPDRFMFRIGAALIGKNPPASFRRDPLTLYDLNPILPRGGFWHFREIPRRRGRYSRALETRENYRLALLFQTLDNDGEVMETTVAETLDISQSGAALVTKLKSGCSDYGLVKSPDRDIRLLARIRRVKPLEDDGAVKLNLEFVSGEWPFL
ncbi:MAG: hypothetical protein JSS81_20530 [Acidobacteria bacterium]|nr:hypothetical protein [Acidobacteriota bacterium]